MHDQLGARNSFQFQKQMADVYPQLAIAQGQGLRPIALHQGG